MSIVRTVVMATAMLAFATLPATIVEARQGASKHKSGAPGGAGQDAEASLDKARRALTEGKAETAQQLADAVLTSAKKDTRSTARALAIRGEAYLNLGRPAEAVADLDSALWLKGGLSGRERELATVARSRAMQTGGIAGATPVAKAPLAAPHPVPEPPRASSPPPTRSVASTTPPRRVSESPAWSNAAVTVAPAPPSPRTTAAERSTAAAPALSMASASDTRSAAPLPWSTAPKAAPTPPPQQDVEESKPSGGGITGFFSNLFGGGQSAEAQTAATGAVASSAPPRQPAVSSFAPQRLESEPRVSRAPAPRPASVQTAAMVAPARPSVPPPAPRSSAADGMYRLQLAAVRTKAEAQAMAEKVRAEGARLIGPRDFEIIEDVYGNMGRFYRVRIGPFPEATQALSICAALRDRRVDCMVLDPNPRED